MSHMGAKLIAMLLVLVSWNVEAQEAKPAKPATPVIVAKVERKSVYDEMEALGTLKANESVDLTATVTELITIVNFTDGQRVRNGQVLVQMDNAEEMALKVEEQSRLKEAERQVQRLKPLVARGAASQLELDKQLLELQTARARMDAIESRVRQRQISAPFDGVLGQRNISVGALVQPGTLITTIDDDSVMKLDFSVPALFLPVLNIGAKIEARSSAWPKDVFEGTIQSVSSRVDPVTRSVSVRALLDNHKHKLRPGMLMRVKVQKNRRMATVIPEEAIITKGNHYTVMIADQQEDGGAVAKQVAVHLGKRFAGQVEIIEGLEQGMQVITHGGFRLNEGGAVTIKAQDDGSASIPEILSGS